MGLGSKPATVPQASCLIWQAQGCQAHPEGMWNWDGVRGFPRVTQEVTCVQAPWRDRRSSSGPGGARQGLGSPAEHGGQGGGLSTGGQKGGTSRSSQALSCWPWARGWPCLAHRATEGGPWGPVGQGAASSHRSQPRGLALRTELVLCGPVAGPVGWAASLPLKAGGSGAHLSVCRGGDSVYPLHVQRPESSETQMKPLSVGGA